MTKGKKEMKLEEIRKKKGRYTRTEKSNEEEMCGRLENKKPGKDILPCALNIKMMILL